jgi:hyperpolarization activated cyclic nucleotide-gated potassium channel 2
MASAAAIAIKIAEFQDSKNKLRSMLSYIRSSIHQLPQEEIQKARQLTITLNTEIQDLIEFANEDLKKNSDEALRLVAEKIEGMRKEMKSPLVAKAEIQANYLQRKWFPTTFEELFMYPYDIYRGITQPEGIYDNSCRFHPRSIFSQAWCSIYSFFIIIYALLLPVGLAFDASQGLVLPITLFLMTITAFDTYLIFDTGIIVEQELEMNKKNVFQFYWKKYTLLYNVFGGFPYVIIADAIFPYGSSERKAMRLVCMINAFMVPKMFASTRVSLVSEKITQWMQTYEINQSLVKSVYIITGMACYWHWFSCSVVFLQWFSILPDPYPLLEDKDHYTVFFFESASIMFSAAWGAVPPVATHDRLSKICNMVMSAFLLALFTANITTFMIRLDSSGRLFAEKLEEVSQYIQYKGLGRDIQQRIFQYYHFKYSKGKYFDEEKILAELNQPLRVSISMRECRPLIVQVPFFKDADHSFITQVVTILKVNHFLHDDIIIEQGTTGDQMFFIESGSVEVIVDGKSVAILESGKFFGGNLYFIRNQFTFWPYEKNRYNQGGNNLCVVFFVPIESARYFGNQSGYGK